MYTSVSTLFSTVILCEHNVRGVGGEGGMDERIAARQTQSINRLPHPTRSFPTTRFYTESGKTDSSAEDMCVSIQV